jgi:transposase InsO family protein
VAKPCRDWKRYLAELCIQPRPSVGEPVLYGESFAVVGCAPNEWQTKAEARHAIFEFIEVWYNRQRRHSTLGYVSPSEYEARLAA